MEHRQKAVQSFAIGAVLAAVFAVAVTIAAELMPPLKTWLADTFTHHWIGRQFMLVLPLLFLPFLPRARRNRRGKAWPRFFGSHGLS